MRKDKLDELADVAEFEILHARAAIMTTVLALEGKGVHAHVAILLRGVDQRMARVQENVQRITGRPVITHRNA